MPTEEEYCRAVEQARGVLSEAARALGCSRSAVERATQRWPSVKAARDEGRATLVDRAEFQLSEHVEHGNLEAVTFTLKTLGRDRGFGDVREVRGFHEVRSFSDLLDLVGPEDDDDEPPALEEA